MEEIKTHTSSKQTPDWIKALEAQSWQAELLLSGAILASLFRVPDILERWITPMAINSTGLGFEFLKYASLYLFGAISSIIVFFGIHLFLRGIWIALLGLNSVYPDGINVSSTVGAGPKAWVKQKEKYPNLSKYNKELDDKCSLIFSVAILGFIISFSLSVVVMSVFLIFKFLIYVFPGIEAYVLPICIGIYTIFLFMSFFSMYLAKKKQDSPRAEKFIEKYTDVNSVLFSLYFFKTPMNYISSILSSNSTSLIVGTVPIIFGMLLGMFGGMQTGDNPILNYLSSNRYFQFNNRTHMKFNFNYENLRNTKYPIFTPIIPSDVIKESNMPLFIPFVGRETEAIGVSDLSLIQKIKLGRKKRSEIFKY